MATVSESKVSLRFFADDLDPDEVTALLGLAPTESVRKGQARNSGTIARTGSWIRTVTARSPADLDAQVAEVLEGLTDDTQTWLSLTRRARADIFCGLFLADDNEGVELSPATLLAAGRRNLRIGFDLYALSDAVLSED